MKPHLLTPQQVYQRKKRVWQAWTQWHVRIVRAFFPDTGGSLHLMHNWHRCAERTNPAGARLPEYEREAVACKANKARHDDNNAQRILALTKVAAPFGEHVHCDERSGEPRPVSIDREGKFSLTAKPYCDSLKLEIEVSPEIAGRIAALLAAL